MRLCMNECVCAAYAWLCMNVNAMRLLSLNASLSPHFCISDANTASLIYEGGKKTNYVEMTSSWRLLGLSKDVEKTSLDKYDFIIKTKMEQLTVMSLSLCECVLFMCRTVTECWAGHLWSSEIRHTLLLLHALMS